MTNCTEKFIQYFSSYFDIEREVVKLGLDFDFHGLFNQRNAKYMLMKKLEYYAFSNHEHILFKESTNVSAEDIDTFVNALKENLDEFVNLNEEHMETQITLIYCVGNGITNELRTKVRQTNYSKSFMFGLKGWLKLKIIVVDPTSNEVITNRFANKDQKNLMRFIKKF